MAESVTKAGECVSESTLHQCFSRTNDEARTEACEGGKGAACELADGVECEAGAVGGRRDAVQQHASAQAGGRNASAGRGGASRDCLNVSRVGRGYVASVGRVRVAGACPLGALALACEWAGVLGVRV